MLKVAIIGTVPNSKNVAPYDDGSWEIWVCSPGNSQQGAPPRITKWFEIHALVDMLGKENAAWCPAYFAWLRAQSFPIYMQERNEHVPNALPFPRKPLVQRWGENPKEGRTNWFTSSIAWMMAYALHLGAQEIGIWGVDMAATEEHYSWQKAGCLRFVEIARSMGVRVVIPLESTLATPAPMYGYAEASQMGRAMIIRSIEMKERIDQREAQRRALENEISFFRGAYEQMEFERRTFVSGLEDAEIDEEDVLPSSLGHLTARAAELAASSGAGLEQNFEERPSGLLVPTSGAVEPPVASAPTAEDFADNPEARALLAPTKPPVKSKRAKPNGSAEAQQ